MRSPFGYCRIRVERKANGTLTCGRWVRVDRRPRRCPEHAQIPETDMESLGENLRAVYLKSLQDAPMLAQRIYKRFADIQDDPRYEFPVRGPKE